MYASEPFFNFEPRRPVVPSWFRGLVVPFLLLLALPLSLAGAGSDAGPHSRPARCCACSSAVRLPYARSRNGPPMARRS